MTSSPALSLVNLRTWNGGEFVADALHLADGERQATPTPNALTLDLGGARVVPAFLNAHDHLELNHFPRTKYHDTYPNSHQWGAEVNQRLNHKPLAPLRKHGYAHKIHVGLVKNLLSGVLTVIQHGEPRKELFTSQSPVTVLRGYQWAHSLHFATPQAIQHAHENTPHYGRFYIHLAEGTDDIAHAEYAQLCALGCVDERTVLVHGVGMSEATIANAVERGATLVTCPTTNQYLLGKTANVPRWNEQVVLGSDSRLTADGDFLDEMSAFAQLWGEVALWNAVHHAHQRLMLPEQGTGDWVVLGDDLKRASIRLILKNGMPVWGEPALMRPFSNIKQVDAILDGKPFRANVALARWLMGGKLREQGLSVDLPFYRRWWWLRIP
jgi:hypothetical protein